MSNTPIEETNTCREIKFRVWNFERTDFGIYSIEDAQRGKLGGRGMLWYDEFTGILDKNGQEIYENDIVRVFDWSIKKVLLGRVYFENGAFRIRVNEHFKRDTCFDDNIEVIGNIHQNKYLLSVELSTNRFLENI